MSPSSEFPSPSTESGSATETTSSSALAPIRMSRLKLSSWDSSSSSPSWWSRESNSAVAVRPEAPETCQPSGPKVRSIPEASGMSHSMVSESTVLGVSTPIGQPEGMRTCCSAQPSRNSSTSVWSCSRAASEASSSSSMSCSSPGSATTSRREPESHSLSTSTSITLGRKAANSVASSCRLTGCPLTSTWAMPPASEPGTARSTVVRTSSLSFQSSKNSQTLPSRVIGSSASKSSSSTVKLSPAAEGRSVISRASIRPAECCSASPSSSTESVEPGDWCSSSSSSPSSAASRVSPIGWVGRPRDSAVPSAPFSSASSPSSGKGAKRLSASAPSPEAMAFQ